MVLAHPNLSEDQQADYQRANALLNTTDANGFTIDSASRTVYKQYRDKYISAEQAYKSAQSTADMSQDAAVKKRWQDTDDLNYASRRGSVEVGGKRRIQHRNGAEYSGIV